MLAAAAMLAMGCNREETPAPTPTGTIRKVSYIACGEESHATVTGEAEWQTLMNRLFDAVEVGCELTFWNPDSVGGETQPKDVVTYRTASRDSAFAWSERMYDQGYTVSVVFDTIGHVYVGSAVKMIVQHERRIGFITCGGNNSYRTITSETGWTEFLDWLYDIIEGGVCRTRYWDFDYQGDNTNLSKDTVFYVARSRASAYAWSSEMVERGYVVSVKYNASDGSYRLGAVPLVTASVEYTPVPLATYLSGTWVKEPAIYFKKIDGQWKQQIRYFEEDNRYDDTLIVSADTMYMSNLRSGRGEYYHGYTIIDEEQIDVDGYNWDCYILQLNTDSMLFVGYGSISTVYEDTESDYGILFRRID